MKLNRLFLLAAMGLGLFACNDNDLVEGSAPNGTQEEGTTYVGLKINFNSSSSRANTGDQPIDGDGTTTPPLYDDAGEGNEALINDVRIVVTDADGKSQYNNVIKGTLNGSDSIYLFEITPGIKKFYAVVNGNILGLGETLNNWAGSQLTLIKKASELCDYNASPRVGKGFLMSSVEAVEQTLQDNVSEDDVKAGKANNIEITVERVVAKVTMQLSDALKAPDGFKDQTATLKNLTCQIGNADNLVYAKGEQKATYTTAGTYLMAYNNEGNVRTTPYFNYPESIDDWSQFLQSDLLGTSATIYENGAVSTTTPTARFYCLENTHANTDSKNYLQSNTTFIRVKAEMIPNSAKQFAYSADPDPKVTISDRVAMPTSLETFYVITGAPDQDNQDSYVFASDLASLYADLVPDGDADNNDDKAAEVVEALADYDYNFTAPYTAGCGYYNIWVNDMKDANNQYLNIAPVFRNDWYNLTITSLTLPGSPKESIDPEEPIHPDTNVGVTLTIRDWNKVNHNVDLQ